jgi:hypothetical protein
LSPIEQYSGLCGEERGIRDLKDSNTIVERYQDWACAAISCRVELPLIGFLTANTIYDVLNVTGL